MAKLISGRHNEELRRARLLERDAAERGRAGLYLIWGRHLAQEALRVPESIDRVFVSASLSGSEEGRGLRARLEALGSRIRETSDRMLDSVVAGAGDQGVVLLVRRPERDLSALLQERPTLILMAHGVQDPGNLGSMARSALVLGGDALVTLEGCADPFSSRAARAAMGALFRLDVAASRAAEALPQLRAAGVRVVAADPDKGSCPDAIDLRPPSALVCGNEGQGLPREILAQAQERIRVPMAGGPGSLNVAAAAAVLLYEAMRQRGFPPLREAPDGPARG